MNDESEVEKTSDGFNWNEYGAYRVFDEFLQRFLIERKSYITTHENGLDIESALEDIRHRFVEEFDESKTSFDEKLSKQFEGAALNTRIVFANVYYLWAMPMENMRPETKRGYIADWLIEDSTVHSQPDYYPADLDTIANPGQYYLRHKYWEIVAILRIVNMLIEIGDLSNLNVVKSQIKKLCYSAIYEGAPTSENFTTKDYCAANAALLHLSSPAQFQPIIADSHKDQICAVFSYALGPDDESLGREEKINLIRKRLYDNFGQGVDQAYKHRWFFYLDEVKPLWNNNKTKRSQRSSSAHIQINEEESAEGHEGGREESTGFRIVRDPKIVKAAKKRAKFTCEVCGFHYKDRIVQAHHLDPLSERKESAKTKSEDLVCLCPNCHYLVHHLLPDDPRLKERNYMLQRLKEIGGTITVHGN